MKVSVAVPSRNQGRYVRYAIDSLINQEFDGVLEVLVRDCLSDDGTGAVLDCYADHPSVQVCREADLGQSDALTKAFEQATGDVFCWLNSDDILFPGALSHVCDRFDREADTDVVYGDAAFIDEAGEVVGGFPTAHPSMERLMHRCVISQPSVFFRRSAYFSVGGLNPQRHFCLDYELWLKFARAGMRFERIPRLLSGTRLHDQTKTANGGLAFIREICVMQQEVVGHVSPVWEVYIESRSDVRPELSPKWLRFSRAAARVLARRPWSVVPITSAFFERLAAQFAARIRGATPPPA